MFTVNTIQFRCKDFGVKARDETILGNISSAETDPRVLIQQLIKRKRDEVDVPYRFGLCRDFSDKIEFNRSPLLLRLRACRRGREASVQIRV